MAAVSLVTVVACDEATPAAVLETAEEAGHAAAPEPRYWLRYADILETPDGKVVRTIYDPVLVELGEGGLVRSAKGAPDAFEGYLPKAYLQQPADREGLMLYAQKTSELHAESPEGTVIGRLHPGAFVSVAPHDDKNYRIAVPRYKAANFPGEVMGGLPLYAFVERAALGPQPVAEVPPKLEGTLYRDFHGAIAFDSGPGTSLLCGEYYASKGRLTQYYAGIEIAGQGEPPINLFASYLALNRCPPRHVVRGPAGLVVLDGRDWLDARIIRTIPAGYLPVRLPDVDPLAETFRRRGAVHWLVTTARGVECHEWAFRPAPAGKGDVNPAMVRGELFRQRDARRADFGVEYAPSSAPDKKGDLTLWGPHFATGGGWKCGDVFSLVGSEEDVLYVDHPHPTHNRRGALPAVLTRSGAYELAAFPPNEVEQWFLTPEACEKARTKASAAIAKDPRAIDVSGIHFDCYEELHE